MCPGDAIEEAMQAEAEKRRLQAEGQAATHGPTPPDPELEALFRDFAAKCADRTPPLPFLEIEQGQEVLEYRWVRIGRTNKQEPSKYRYYENVKGVDQGWIAITGRQLALGVAVGGAPYFVAQLPDGRIKTRDALAIGDAAAKPLGRPAGSNLRQTLMNRLDITPDNMEAVPKVLGTRSTLGGGSHFGYVPTTDGIAELPAEIARRMALRLLT